MYGYLEINVVLCIKANEFYNDFHLGIIKFWYNVCTDQANYLKELIVLL